MGITRKCDRCGKYYLRNIKHKVPGKSSVTMEGITFVDVTASVIEWFCLCDDCITKLKDFMVMEENKNGN